MSLRDRLVSRLTDAYNKKPNSNISKVISVIVREINQLNETFNKIESWRSIDKAEGQTLDDMGRDLRQPRGVATDEIYRVLLKSKVARDLSTGDTNTIIEVLAMTLDTDKSEINIIDGWADVEDPEPASIKVIETPIRKLNEIGMNSHQFARLVELTVASGVAVKSIDLQGTFEYGGDTLETDENKGYADIEMTAGGYYGTLYIPGHRDELPI